MGGDHDRRLDLQLHPRLDDLVEAGCDSGVFEVDGVADLRGIDADVRVLTHFAVSSHHAFFDAWLHATYVRVQEMRHVSLAVVIATDHAPSGIAKCSPR